MRKILLLLTTLLLFNFSLICQKVDNIIVEQAGDFIKIRYKILNSTLNQTYNVNVFCAINGGADNEIRSITGDVGKVAGGKTEYQVIWDVLKDVDELKSVEFTVRAELLNDYYVKTETVKTTDDTRWDKKRINALSNIEVPGPKIGACIGYLGKWGLLLKIVKGKTTKDSDADSKAEPGTIPVFPAYSSGITKRIINLYSVQVHLYLGVANSKFVFYQKNNLIYTFTDEILAGPEFGLVLGAKSLSAMITVSSFNAGSVENGTNLKSWSAHDFIGFGLGVRF
jgi:hypothetical protein